MLMKVCKVIECEVPVRAKEYCSHHYYSWVRYGDPNQAKSFKMERRICFIDGCNNLHHSKGYCSKHYNTFTKYGTPLPTKQQKQELTRDKKYERLGAEASKCDYCDAFENVPGSKLCKFHNQRRKDGVDLSLPKKEYNLGNPGYTAMHDKVRKERGRAAEQECIICRNTAFAWTLRKDADILIQEVGTEVLRGKLFSRNIYDYDPMCQSCHAKYDLENNLRWDTYQK